MYISSSLKNNFKTFFSITLVFAISACSMPNLNSNSKNDSRRTLQGGAGCCGAEKRDVIDPLINKTRQDYLDGLYDDGFPNSRNKKFRKDQKKRHSKPSVPNLLNFVGGGVDMPEKTKEILVSVSVTEEIPIKDVILELSRKAGVDVEIDSGIKGGIIFTATDQPFSRVIDRIADLAGLVYNFNNGVLKVTRDVPSVVNYRLNLLNVNRNASSKVTSDTTLEVESSGEDGTGGGTTTGTESELEISSTQEDMWEVLREGLTNLINEYNLTQGAFVSQIGHSGSEQNETEANSESVAAARGSEYRSAVLSINKKTGIVSILATEKQHKEIKSYLDYINLSNTSQVLIEAKVIEVNLDDQYKSGVDWNAVIESGSDTIGLTSDFLDSGSVGTTSASGAAGVFSFVANSDLGLDNFNLGAAVDLVEEFGVTRTLSSPRLNAMNNQPAILTFAENFVYARLDVDSDATSSDGGILQTVDVESEIKSVPIGVILNLQPSIDLQRNEVVLSVRPTLTRITGFIDDPATIYALREAGIDDVPPTQIPVVEVREIDTVMRLDDGEVMVIGGLIREEIVNIDRGVPGVSKIPLIGNAFKNVDKRTNFVETVIFLKATINRGQEVEVMDKEFYKDFFPLDRRPLF